MQNALEQAYSAIERSYAEGRFAEALEQAMGLQPQLEAGRTDLLDQRLQLLIGHIHLYGLAQPQPAAAAYEAVLAQCHEPAYRQLAEQGLALCEDHDDQAVSTPAAASPRADLPATPWLAQLNDPLQALAEIQQAWATVTPAAQPEPPRDESGGIAASPWAAAAPTPDQQPASIPAAQTDPPAATSEPSASELAPEPAAEPMADGPAPAVPEAIDNGLLLVRLSKRSVDHAAATGLESPQPPEREQEPTPQQPSQATTAPSLGAAWTLFKRNWRTYLILEGLWVAAALVGAGLQLLGPSLQGLAEVNPLLVLAPGLALLIGALAVNLWSNLLGVALQAAPAMAFTSGEHPSAAQVIALLRRDFWRLVRAGVVVGLATGIGLLLFIVPGLLVAIATPVIVRRVFCNNEPTWSAVLTSVKEVGNGAAGAGLVKWELVAGLLILASLLICGLPLLITAPLGGIMVQHYIAYSGLGAKQT